VQDVYALFEPFLVDAGIDVDLQFVDESPLITGSAAAVEAIVANLLTNTINAFNAGNGRTRRRQVVIRTELSGDDFLLRVMDNGPGIRGLSVDDVWLPGQTTIPGGTGLGLTIVRDSVMDLGGTVQALAQGELGGAEFVVQIPRTKE
jgi:C4-dicarboxylate-specific signal transduction histidine kinase